MPTVEPLLQAVKRDQTALLSRILFLHLVKRLSRVLMSTLAVQGRFQGIEVGASAGQDGSDMVKFWIAKAMLKVSS